MLVTIRYNRCDRADFGDLDPADFLNNSFAKFQRRLRQVYAYVEDVNGPRGGIDKRCRCVLHLKRRPPVVIQDQDSDLQTLIRRVAERAIESISQQSERRISRAKGKRWLQTEMLLPRDATRSMR